MRALLLAASVVAVLGTVVAAGPTETIAATLTEGAGRWAERAHRVPVVTPGEAVHASLSLGGGRLAQHRAVARTLEEVVLEGGPVVAVAEREGVVMLGLFDGGVWQIRHGEEPRQLAVDERANDLALGRDGSLWAATAGGAFQIRPDGTIVRLAPGAFQAVAIWRGQAWFASPRGLSVADAKGFWTRGAGQGFAADGAAVLADCGPRLCAGALDGLWMWDGHSAERLASDSGALPTDWVTAVAFGEGVLWAGTFDGGLARLVPDSRRASPGDGLPDGRVQPHALVVKDGGLWAGTPAGIVEVRGTSAALITEGLPSQDVTALASAREGGLWMGWSGGAARIEIEDVEVAP